MKVYAGIDQYRSGIRDELYRVERKAQAGAAGFFTQPFFDMRYLEMFADLLDGHEIYWGVSPVLSSRSRGYWERKDKAVFPKNFLPTMDWNIDFAKQVIDFIKTSRGGTFCRVSSTNKGHRLSSRIKSWRCTSCESRRVCAPLLNFLQARPCRL